MKLAEPSNPAVHPRCVVAPERPGRIYRLLRRQVGLRPGLADHDAKSAARILDQHARDCAALSRN